MKRCGVINSLAFRIVILCCLVSAALTTSVQAGGLYLHEYGTPSMGTAGAGSPAWGDDASTVFHNPAGMTRVQGKELMVTGMLVKSRVKFDTSFVAPVIGGGDGGDAGGLAPVGALFP